MKKSTKILVWVMGLSLVVIVALKYILPILKARSARATSDAVATKGRITIPIDSWAGYFPLRSPRMKKEMRESGYLLECEDDKADTVKRAARLDKGEVDFAVFTVDSYLLNAAKYKFPGTFVMVIDESKGGDAIVAYGDSLPNLDAFKTNKYFKVAFTPNSPSHQLLRIAGAHFDIPALKRIAPSRKIETAGSEEASKLFRDKKVDAAVLWEPDLSKSLLQKGAVRILGTENMTRSIVDVLVVNRDYAEKNKEIVEVLFRSYFRILKHYSDHPDDLKSEMQRELGYSKDQAEAVVKGVSWINLTENAQDWFGLSSAGTVGEKGLVDTIETSIEVLRDSGDVTENPLPNKDPYFITNRKFIETLFQTGIKNGFKSLAHSSTNTIGKFAALSELQWSKQREVGTIKVEPITFQKGSSTLTLQGKEELDKIGIKIKHYPTFRIALKGHTSPDGDREVNKELSLSRAEAAKQYLVVTFALDEDRMHVVGYGGERPLPRQPEESDRAYNFRQSRVELALLSDVF